MLHISINLPNIKIQAIKMDPESFVEIDRYSQIILYVVDGANGLLSSDPFSMEMLLNIKLNNCTRIEVRKPRMYTTADLPKLHIDGTTYTHPKRIRKIIEKITKNKINLEYAKVGLSRLSAYFAHAERYLVTSALLHYWGNEENATESTKNYSRGMWFPFGILYSRNMRKKMSETIDFIVGDEDMKVYMERKFADLDAYFKDLANILGTKKYLVGDHPTTLDLYICSNLAPAFRVQYTNTQFLNVVNANSTIADYVKNFLQEYSPLNEPIENEKPVDDDRASILLLATAGITAIGAMTLFAWIHGLLHH